MIERPRISSRYDFRYQDWYFERDTKLPRDTFQRGISADAIVIIGCAIAAGVVAVMMLAGLV